MDTQEAMYEYEAALSTITDACVDPWFTVQLAKYRAGYESARRNISGSCLRLVFDTANRKWKPDCPISFLDLVQEGNVVLMRTIKKFRGSTADEFLDELRTRLEYELTFLAVYGRDV
jgi:DNA-directed RNA polymerase sigma subunit (sigma70/sigma32)